MEWDDKLTSHTEIATTSTEPAELMETAADYEVIWEKIRDPTTATSEIIRIADKYAHDESIPQYTRSSKGERKKQGIAKYSVYYYTVRRKAKSNKEVAKMRPLNREIVMSIMNEMREEDIRKELFFSDGWGMTEHTNYIAHINVSWYLDKTPREIHEILRSIPTFEEHVGVEAKQEINDVDIDISPGETSDD